MPEIRYVLDARVANDHFPGIGRYVASLARALVPHLREDERLILLRDPGPASRWDLGTLTAGRVEVVDVAISPFSLRQQWLVPRALRRVRADLYHSPYWLMPYRPGAPTVLTLADLIPMLLPERVSARARLLFPRAARWGLRSARHVIAISTSTREDLGRAFPTVSPPITVIPLAADPGFRPRTDAEIGEVRRRHRLPEAYVLYVGGNAPHKNLVRLVEAWASLDADALRRAEGPADARSSTGGCPRVHDPASFPLVIAGAWDPRHDEPRRRARVLGLGDRVRWLGPVAEADLPPLYSGAAALVLPSLYEGFGLPVLEAMACGTPVACSDVSSLPEIAGGAALLFDPTDPSAIGDALGRLLGKSELREELGARGLARAAEFSWERTAEETLAVYRQVVG